MVDLDIDDVIDLEPYGWRTVRVFTVTMTSPRNKPQVKVLLLSIEFVFNNIPEHNQWYRFNNILPIETVEHEAVESGQH
jgi:hypothetical protein